MKIDSSCGPSLEADGIGPNVLTPHSRATEGSDALSGDVESSPAGIFLTPSQRVAVVDEAKAWVTARTPYMPHARLKGLGCDCATFILCVYRDLGLVEDVDAGCYSIQAHLHKPMNPAHEKLLTQYVDTILRFADEISEAEAQPGDMVLFKTARAFAHGAIVIAWPTVAHAAIGHGVIFADVSTDPHLKGRERRFFRRNFSKSFTAEATEDAEG